MSQATPSNTRPAFAAAAPARPRKLRLRSAHAAEHHDKEARPPLPARRLPLAERARLRHLADTSQAAGTDPDVELVASAKAGDTRAFEQLMGKYQHRVIKLVTRLVGEADAPDVAQVTFVKIHRALPAFRGQSSFYTWLYRIAINTAKNHLMSRQRRPAAQDIDIADVRLEQGGDLGDHETPEAIVESWELRDRLVLIMNKLPTELRRTIVLRELEGLSYEAIAEVTNCPLGTVRSRLFRAREAVEKAVGPSLLN